MTLLFIDGFDHYQFVGDKYSTYFASPSTVTTLPRTGTRHLSLIDDSRYIQKNLEDNHVTLIAGVALHIPGSLGIVDEWEYCFAFLDNGTYQVWVEYNDVQRKFRVRSGAFTSGSSSVIDLTDGYFYIELKVTFNIAGSYELKVNGTTEANGAGVNTRPSGNAQGNQVRISSALDGTTYFDDFYVCNALGATNNDFLGSVEVHTLYPDADGNQNDFTPLGGSDNYLEVDETPVDDDTSYVYSGTNGHIDLYDVDTLSGLDTILGVQVNTIATKTEAAVATMQVGVRSGGANDWGSITHLLGQSVYVNYEEIWEQDPNGPIAWVTANLNNAEFGFKIGV